MPSPLTIELAQRALGATQHHHGTDQEERVWLKWVPQYMRRWLGWKEDGVNGTLGWDGVERDGKIGVGDSLLRYEVVKLGWV